MLREPNTQTSNDFADVMVAVMFFGQYDDAREPAEIFSAWA